MIIEHAGRRFRVEHTHDDTMREPWIEHDGHGVISDWTTRDKAPHERIVAEDQNRYRYYDTRASLERARADGWDAPPYGGTPAQQAARAMLADFEYCRAWCADEWQWIGVVVTLLDAEDKPTRYTASLWGIESLSEAAYLETVAQELVDDILTGLPDAVRQDVAKLEALL